MTPNERFEKYKRLAYFAIRLVWPDQSRQKQTACKFGMEYEDFDQVALMELWRCCLNFDGISEKGFASYAVKSIKFALLDTMRRRGSLIKYTDDVKDRVSVSYFESLAPESKRGGDSVDMHSLIDSGRSVESTVIAKITLEEKLSVLNENERRIVIYKLKSLSQKEIESLGFSIPRQDYFIRKAFQKLGVERKKYKAANG